MEGSSIASRFAAPLLARGRPTLFHGVRAPLGRWPFAAGGAVALAALAIAARDQPVLARVALAAAAAGCALLSLAAFARTSRVTVDGEALTVAPRLGRCRTVPLDRVAADAPARAGRIALHADGRPITLTGLDARAAYLFFSWRGRLPADAARALAFPPPRTPLPPALRPAERRVYRAGRCAERDRGLLLRLGPRVLYLPSDDDETLARLAHALCAAPPTDDAAAELLAAVAARHGGTTLAAPDSELISTVVDGAEVLIDAPVPRRRTPSGVRAAISA
jgi:hypothetical protein